MPGGEARHVCQKRGVGRVEGLQLRGHTTLLALVLPERLDHAFDARAHFVHKGRRLFLPGERADGVGQLVEKGGAVDLAQGGQPQAAQSCFHFG